MAVMWLLALVKARRHWFKSHLDPYCVKFACSPLVQVRQNTSASSHIPKTFFIG